MPNACRLLAPLLACLALLAAAPAASAAPPVAQPAAPQQPAPAAPAPQPDAAPAPAADPFAGLDAKSPSCQGPLSPESEANCRGSDSPAHPYQVNNYGLDQHVDVSVTNIGSSLFDRITQWIVTSVWLVLVYVLDGVLLMLDWAFSLSMHGSLTPIGDALQTMHNTVIQPWGLVAIAGLALWGIWNGLVRAKTIDTLRGLALSLICMITVLVVIADPVHTLGSVMSSADSASAQVLNSITRQQLSGSKEGIAAGERTLWDVVVLRPWCALQFGDVDYCLSKPSGAPAGKTVADAWLQTPPGSPLRQGLYDVTSAHNVQDAQQKLAAEGGGPQSSLVAHDTNWGCWFGHMFDFSHPFCQVTDPSQVNKPQQSVQQAAQNGLGDATQFAGHPDKVALQGSGSTVQRLALLAVITFGMLGAIFLFLYLAFQLLNAALKFLILVLFGPWMFLIAALGEAGRLTWVAWAKRTVAALVVKVIYAAFLAIVLLGMLLMIELKLGFFATWLVAGAFWWGVFLHRRDLIGLLSLDHRTATPGGISVDGARSGNALGELYFASRLAGMGFRQLRRTVGAATAPARAMGRRLADSADAERSAAVDAESEVVRDLAQEELEETARGAIYGGRLAEHRRATANPLLAAERSRAAAVRDAEGSLAGEQSRNRSLLHDMRAHKPGSAEWNDLHETVGVSNMRVDAWQETLRDRRSELDQIRSDPAFQAARATANRAPQEASDQDVRSWIQDRRRQIGGDPGDTENLWAAGIDPASGRTPDQLQRSRAQMERDRALLNRIGDGSDAPLTRDVRVQARREAEARNERGNEVPGDYRDYRDRVRDATPPQRARQQAKRHAARRRRVR